MTGPPRDYDGLVALLVARQATLTRRHADVARFCLNHPEDVAINTIVRLAHLADVPPATITRFAQDLGFTGFPDLQRVFRERLLGPRAYADQMDRYRARPAPVEISDTDLEHPAAVFDTFVHAAMASLIRIEQALDRAMLDGAVGVLAGAGAVHVAASRGAYGIGAYAFYGLARTGKRAHLIDNQGAMRAEQVGAMAPGDAALILTFDDYTPETVQVARMAHDAGHPVIAITDNELSPVVPLATHTLYVKEARLGHFRSQVPAMVVAQAIIVSVGRRIGQVGPVVLQTEFHHENHEKTLASNQKA
jgi:DNA-binding MurR/RpiR family transcriptional regulator